MGNLYTSYEYNAATFEEELNQKIRFLALAGEDRGARINITGSTFKHSKFCKGLIVYNR